MKNSLKKKKGVKCGLKIWCFIISREFLLFMELLSFIHLIFDDDIFLKIIWNIYEVSINSVDSFSYVKYVICIGFLTFQLREQ